MSDAPIAPGMWKLSSDGNYATFEPIGYEIFLGRVHTLQDIQNLIRGVSEKNWVSAQALADLTDLLLSKVQKIVAENAERHELHQKECFEEKITLAFLAGTLGAQEAWSPIPLGHQFGAWSYCLKDGAPWVGIVDAPDDHKNYEGYGFELTMFTSTKAVASSCRHFAVKGTFSLPLIIDGITAIVASYRAAKLPTGWARLNGAIQRVK